MVIMVELAKHEIWNLRSSKSYFQIKGLLKVYFKRIKKNETQLQTNKLSSNPGDKKLSSHGMLTKQGTDLNMGK